MSKYKEIIEDTLSFISKNIEEDKKVFFEINQRILNNDLDEARERLTENDLESKNQELYYLFHGCVQYLKENYKEAEKYYVKIKKPCKYPVPYRLLNALNNFQLKNYEESLGDLKNITEKQNNNSAVFELQGDILTELDEKNKAKIAYEKSIQKYQTDIFLSVAHQSQIKRIYDKILSLNVYTFDTLIKQGLESHENGEYDIALKFVDKSLDLQPENYQALLLKAMILKNTDNHKKAIVFFKRALKNTSESSPPWISEMINPLLQIGKNEEAFDITNNLIEKYPDNHWYYDKRGIILTHKEKYDDALEQFKKAIKLSKEKYDKVDSRIDIHKSATLFKKGEYQKALHLFNQPLKDNEGRYFYPDEIRYFLKSATQVILEKREKEKDVNDSIEEKIKEHWYELALYENDYGNDEKAAECFDQTLKISQSLDYEQGFLASEIYGITEKFEKKLFVCNLVLQNDPNDTLILEDKIDALRELGRYQEALKTLENIQKLSSMENPRWEDWRISLLNLTGKHKDAIQALDERLKKYNEGSSGAYDRSYALYNLGEHEKAISILKKLAQTSIQGEYKANIFYFLGYIYGIDLSKYKEALNYLNKASELDPDNKTIKKTKNGIQKIINGEEPRKIIKTEIPKYKYSNI